MQLAGFLYLEISVFTLIGSVFDIYTNIITNTIVMNKSVIIIISALWVLSTLYYTLARAYGYPYVGAAMVGAWVASFLLLLCIILYVRKHRK